jgi:precorrin-3B methylase
MSETNSGNRLPFDIAIVGLGIVGVHQITPEVEGVIRQSQHTFVIDSGFGVLSFLKSISAKVTDLSSFYEPGKPRLETYRQMAAEVVHEALVDPTVCFAAYGHPLLYCHPSILIQRAAQHLDLRVETFPGISSLDTLLVDLGIDPAADGLQMYETTDLLLRRRLIQNDVPCLLLQVNAIAEPNYQPNRLSAEHFTPLQNYLLEFYPPEHPITLVVSKTFPLLKPIIEKYRVGTLATDLEQGSQAGTLYIAPVRRRPIADREILNRLTASYKVIDSQS